MSAAGISSNLSYGGWIVGNLVEITRLGALRNHGGVSKMTGRGNLIRTRPVLAGKHMDAVWGWSSDWKYGVCAYLVLWLPEGGQDLDMQCHDYTYLVRHLHG